MDKRGCPNYSYGVVNGKLIRKYTLQFDTYPEIEEQVRRMIRLLEEIYELAVTRGMEMRDEPIWEPLCPEPDNSK